MDFNEVNVDTAETRRNRVGGKAVSGILRPLPNGNQNRWKGGSHKDNEYRSMEA